jgi:hypothetical protein
LESGKRFCPTINKQMPDVGFQFPAPIRARMLVHEAGELRDVIQEDAQQA